MSRNFLIRHVFFMVSSWLKSYNFACMLCINGQSKWEQMTVQMRNLKKLSKWSKMWRKTSQTYGNFFQELLMQNCKNFGKISPEKCKIHFFSSSSFLTINFQIAAFIFKKWACELLLRKVGKKSTFDCMFTSVVNAGFFQIPNILWQVK